MSLTKKITETEYKAFQAYLEEACGIVLGDGKDYLVTSRLTRLMREYEIDSITSLLSRIKQMQHHELQPKVIDAMTTNETSWFRDDSPFEVFEKSVLPALNARPGFTVPRIWSAACSSGQEPYTISMLLNEFSEKHNAMAIQQSQIIATDISSKIIEEAKLGQYDDISIQRGLSSQRKARYFSVDKDETWRVKEAVKNKVSFKQQNLLQPYLALGQFDVIFCRNVLIYFSPTRKAEVLKRMADVMRPGGYLFLGASETTQSYSEQFEMIRSPEGVYFQLKS